MNRYNDQGRCPKCGSPDVRDQFQQQSDRPHNTSLSSAYPVNCKEQAEHIHRYCRHCGYNWAERPLDSKE